LRFATEKPCPNSSVSRMARSFRRYVPYPARLLPACLLFFHNQSPDVPVRFDHCVVDGLIGSLPCVMDDLPERIIQGIWYNGVGGQRIISLRRLLFVLRYGSLPFSCCCSSGLGGRCSVCGLVRSEWIDRETGVEALRALLRQRREGECTMSGNIVQSRLSVPARP